MAELTDTLEFWHPQRDEKLDENYFPWGVAVPGSSADRVFRVRNLSHTYTAVDVVVSLQEMGIAEPTLSVAAQHYLSVDGRTFAATAALGSLAPRAVSDRITLRRVTALDADPGFGDFQLLAHPTEWN